MVAIGGPLNVGKTAWRYLVESVVAEAGELRFGVLIRPATTPRRRHRRAGSWVEGWTLSGRTEVSQDG
jgi:hypothetical protein